MPGDSVAAPAPWAGFHGKIPARGDFVRSGLPRDFLAPWDAWMSTVLAETRDRLGAAWNAAWDAAPPCRFLLAPGVCGPYWVGGVWLPSRDRVGRAYPLTLAAEGTSGAFMEHAERVGRTAVRGGLAPAVLGARLAPPWPEAVRPTPPPSTGGLWRRGKAWVACAGLPDAGVFASLLLGEEAL